MPRRKDIRWSQLKVGILSLVSLALLAAIVFLITGHGGFFAKTETLRAFSPDAGGLRTGAVVRLAGVDVGAVEKVQLTGNPSPDQAVEIVMRVDKHFAPEIRSDSQMLLAAEGLLGERYVNITRGTASGTPVPDGGAIPFHPTPEFSELVGGSRDLLDNLNVLTAQLNSVVGTIESGRGTVGRLIEDRTLYDRLNETVLGADKLIADLNAGKGSFGQLLRSDDLYTHFNAAVDKMDGLIDQMQSGNGTIGRLVSDPALYSDTQHFIAQGTALLNNVNQGHGTLGKLATDEGFYDRLNSAVSGANQMMTALQNGQGTIGRLFQDPSLYNNLNGATTELRELVADFRKNPKKFLTIQMKIF